MRPSNSTFLLLVACSGSSGAASPDAITTCTGLEPWGPVSRIDSLDTGDNELGAALSPDGQILVFPRETSLPSDLFYALRQGATFGAPQRMTSVNTNGYDEDPTWSYDGAQLFFRRNTGPIVVSNVTRSPLSFGAPQSPSNFPDNGGYWDHLRFTADGLEAYYADLRGTSRHIMRATRAAATDLWSVASPSPVNELNSGLDDSFPAISSDGLTIIFTSQRTGSYKLFVAHRADRASSFGPPQLANVGQEGGQPELSRDGRMLIFVETYMRTSADLFVTTRECP